MGSVGASTSDNNPVNFVGKNVSELYDTTKKGEESYTDLYNKIRNLFNIPEANERQIDVLRQIIRGINEYDRSYGEEKTPYNITYFSVTELKRELSEEDRKLLGLRKTANPISVHISTEPNTESAYLRMTDSKKHDAIIGANGGLYTYTSGSKRKKLDMFDVAYGKRR